MLNEGLESIAVENETIEYDGHGGYDLNATFFESGLEEVVLPGTLKELRGPVFSRCPLAVVWVAAECRASVRENVDDSAAVIRINGAPERRRIQDLRSLQEISLPEGARAVRDYMFCRSAVRSVAVPASVESLGEGAF